ncbi:hypothetical protein UA08_07028 [Talaromyces atroroseus]|uniref:NACHT domain-containing protein n=1 Tax=Talaromyces atroroseus TaxID=1441469 RepID=A0A225AWB5_TALAT|nr:hypothetical protein UA08_07028 [Talaromyces atroroseus]OKL57787.1 hypothetical protein UA08_07028 [Talaromyces atroroseus]
MKAFLLMMPSFHVMCCCNEADEALLSDKHTARGKPNAKPSCHFFAVLLVSVLSSPIVMDKIRRVKASWRLGRNSKTATHEECTGFATKTREDLCSKPYLGIIPTTESRPSTFSISSPCGSTKIDGAKADNARKKNIPVSLWDRAYDSVKEEKTEIFAEYEILLSDAEANQIPQNDTVRRREMLEKIARLGLKHMEDKKVTVTLLGHKIDVQDTMANVGGAVDWVSTYVNDAIKNVPYAPAVMTGISLVLPLLRSPAAVEDANREGFTYVTSQMRYYIEMESLVLSEDLTPDQKDSLTESVVKLYNLIIQFQVERDQILSQPHQELFQKHYQLRRLGREAPMHKRRGNQDWRKARKERSNHKHATAERGFMRGRNFTPERDMKARDEQRLSNEERQQYLEALQWQNRVENSLLWVKGDPGKGKTMLLCGIIDELIGLQASKHLSQEDEATPNISFFLCQATDKRINNAPAVLRGLIYMLVEEQPALITHLRSSCDYGGNSRFQGINAWEALSKLFTDIIQDPQLRKTYLIVDALDECTDRLDLLLGYIVKHASALPHVKWVISSRNWPSIEKELKMIENMQLNLELNAETVTAAVGKYIEFKVNLLATKNEYDNATRATVQGYLSSNADGTFLWVALVYAELAHISRWEVEDTLRRYPRGLDPFYSQMLNQIRNSRHAKICKDILAVVSLVYRPVTLDELTSPVDFPAGAVHSDNARVEIIKLCGSFLTLRERTVNFIHQSAKDYLLDENVSSEILPDGMEAIQHTIFSKSLKAIAANLRRDVYGLKAPGTFIEQMIRPNLDPLATVQYSCVFWVDHLQDCSPSKEKHF